MKRKPSAKVNKKPVKRITYKSVKKNQVAASSKKVVKSVQKVVPLQEVQPIIEREHEVQPVQPVQEVIPMENNVVTETITLPENKIVVENSNTMLDDMLIETDKDNEPEHHRDELDEMFDKEQEKENDSYTSDDNSTTVQGDKPNLADKVSSAITDDEQDWQNPTDFKKMCSVNAMLYVEGGAILLSFIGQMISGDWTKEGESKYSPSEERKKLIRAPLAKKFELNKDTSKRTPTGALITAIIFTVLPVVIVAFKDRKKRVQLEAQNIEIQKLKEQNLVLTNSVTHLQKSSTIPVVRTEGSTLTPFIVKTRGRHKLNCQCDKCNLKRAKTK